MKNSTLSPQQKQFHLEGRGEPWGPLPPSTTSPVESWEKLHTYLVEMYLLTTNLSALFFGQRQNVIWEVLTHYIWVTFISITKTLHANYEWHVETSWREPHLPRAKPRACTSCIRLFTLAKGAVVLPLSNLWSVTANRLFRELTWWPRGSYAYPLIDLRTH